MGFVGLKEGAIIEIFTDEILWHLKFASKLLGRGVLVNRGKIKHGWPELVIIKAKGWAHGGVSHSSLFFCMSEIFHNEEFLKGHEDSF